MSALVRQVGEDGAVAFEGREHRDVGLLVPPAEQVALGPAARAIEAPEMSDAHDLVPVDDTLTAEIGPLVRTARVHHADLPVLGPPHHQLEWIAIDTDHLANAHLG